MEQPAKKQSKWSNDEDRLIIQLRGENMKWEEISKRLPGRSAISCRLHYQNFLERKAEWTQERDAKLARLYDRFKKDMWEKVAKEMAMPWRAVEARHWEIGQTQMAKLAGVTAFSTAGAPSSEYSPIPHNALPAFTQEYQPSSLRQPFNPYGPEHATHLPARIHPMDPPPRPDYPTTSYGDPRALPGHLPGPMQLLQHEPTYAQPQQTHTAHSYNYPMHDRNLPPLEGQQLPPMRLHGEARRLETPHDPRAPYSALPSEESGKRDDTYSMERR